MTDFAAMRVNMVDGQIQPTQVTDPRVIQAFLDVPRELFVPKGLRGIAYVDEDLEVAPGRHLIEPAVLARMIQAAAVGPDDVVLDIGCATGYSSAVLARLAGTVIGLESDPGLAEQAGATLNQLGVDNAVAINAPLIEGYPKQAPYDVILFQGAIEVLPAAIEDQIAEGGRLVAVLVRSGAIMGRATLTARLRGLVSSRSLFDAGVPRLQEFAAPRGFVF